MAATSTDNAAGSVINTPSAPAAIGPYSQGIRSGDLVFLSGQIGLDPETQHLVKGSIADEARQVFRNLNAVAVAAGGIKVGQGALNGAEQVADKGGALGGQPNKQGIQGFAGGG